MSSASSAPHKKQARLQNKTAIITGGSSGIGRSIAAAYANEGAKVVIADIIEKSKAPEEADVSTVDLLKKNGAEAVFVKCDVSEKSEVEGLVKAAVERFGRLDIMVNNAGIAPEASTGFQPTWKVSLDTWNSVMATNCNGTFYGVQAAASQMLEQESHPDFGGDRGWIINMSSVAGLKAFRGHVSYSSSKHLIIGLTRTAAIDLAHHKVHVNYLAPGFTETPIVSAYFAANPAAREPIANKQPWGGGGMGKPEDIARAAVVLASSDAAWMSGTGLLIDGGSMA